MSEDNFDIKCELIPYDGFIGSQKFDFDKIIYDLNSQIELLSCQADNLDYIVAIASGMACGLLDILWVGEFDLQSGRSIASDKVDSFVKKTAEMLERKKFGDVKSAVKSLEERFPIPSDGNTPSFGGGLQHHIRDFAHHPTIVGLAFSLLTQFTEKSYGTDVNGVFLVVDVPKKSKPFIGKDVPQKILMGTITWFFHLVSDTLSGETATLDFAAADMNTIAVTEKLNTHKHGRDYHHEIGKIGMEIGMEYSYMNTIIRKLFDKNFKYSRKILALEPREVYAFVLNNADRLRHLVREAMAYELAQLQLEIKQKSYYEFRIPQSCLFTYNGDAKTQIIMKKNVYQNYLSSAAPRSVPEVKFEKFCERSDSIGWWYKNGDKGNEYFSIVYVDNSNRQKLFYPDYIISVNGELWIIETKGGFDRSGNSQDIDLYTPKKFGVLKAYLDEHGLKGGIVRNDATTDELCICIDHYSDDIGSNDWQVLESVLP